MFPWRRSELSLVLMWLGHHHGAGSEHPELGKGCWKAWTAQRSFLDMAMASPTPRTGAWLQAWIQCSQWQSPLKPPGRREED